jgi:multidrug transporter EmrE-like cation transporter
MIWLILSIATSSLLYVIFKYFQVFKVNRLHAIVFNYVIACGTGIIAYRGTINSAQILEASWLPYAVFLGFLFIILFNVMALTSQKNGLSVAAVSSKMSLVIPVMAGYWLYDESLGWIKIVGIVLALASVFLTSVKSGGSFSITREYLLLPLLLFAGSGLIDVTLKYAETVHVPDGEEPLFSAVCFIVAFVIGIFVMSYEARQKRYLNKKSIIAGIILGVPNYFSIYFLIKALKTDMESSVIYPINHVGTVLLTSLFGIVFFKEKMGFKNYLGIVIAVIAIVLVALAEA